MFPQSFISFLSDWFELRCWPAAPEGGRGHKYFKTKILPEVVFWTRPGRVCRSLSPDCVCVQVPPTRSSCSVKAAGRSSRENCEFAAEAANRRRWPSAGWESVRGLMLAPVWPQGGAVSLLVCVSGSVLLGWHSPPRSYPWHLSVRRLSRQWSGKGAGLPSNKIIDQLIRK